MFRHDVVIARFLCVNVIDSLLAKPARRKNDENRKDDAKKKEETHLKRKRFSLLMLF